MVDISIVNGLINKLITWGAPPCINFVKLELQWMLLNLNISKQFKMQCKFKMQRIAFTFFTPEISMFSPATAPDSDPCA
jgi:hypothetical protein